MKIIITEEQFNKLLESTDTGSAGSYETPSFIGSRFLKKPIYFSEKGNKGDSMLKGKNAQFVKIKEKCKKFPYCEQGDSIEFPKTYKLNKTKLQEEKVKRDRCLRIADRKYEKPSAYKSGAVVQCRKGKIWKNLKEENNNKTFQVYHLTNNKFEKFSLEHVWDGFWFSDNLENIKNNEVGASGNKYILTCSITLENPAGWEEYDKYSISELIKKGFDGVILPEDNETTYLVFNPNSIKILKREENKISEKKDFDLEDKLFETKRADFSKEKKQGLHGWFSRRGGKGGKGWVDCNTCRNGKCKSCGRQEGEKRSKYPSCRPTPSQCKTPGKGKTWGKTK